MLIWKNPTTKLTKSHWFSMVRLQLQSFFVFQKDCKSILSELQVNVHLQKKNIKDEMGLSTSLFEELESNCRYRCFYHYISIKAFITISLLSPYYHKCKVKLVYLLCILSTI